MAPKKANLKAEIAAAKAREVEVKAVFEQYDVDGSNSIEMDELTALLDDLGLLAGLKTDTIEFVAKIRDEKKFESLDALKIAISEDVSRVKSFFGHQ